MKKSEAILLISLGFIILMLLWKGCQMQRDNDNLLKQVSAYQVGEKQFKSKMQEDSSTIALQTQTILTQEQAVRVGILRLEGQIRKVQSQVRQSQEISISDIAIPFIPQKYADTTEWIAKYKKGDTSRAVCDSLKANSVIVPNNFGVTDKWYSINGKVQKNGVLIDSLQVNNESSVTIGWKNSGFLGLKKEAVVEIKNTNPYLQVTKMNNVVIKKNKNIFQKPFFWLGLGALGGLLIK